MVGIGVRTKRVRIGQIVLFNSLRNPAYLAKSISTLDNMVDGRYECMIGTGWNKIEYEAYDLMEKGRGMPSAKERVDRFEEALIILNGMLYNPTFSYEGSYWKIKDAKNVPQPVQKNMRISVGAKKPRMLKITAKYADGLNIASGVEDMGSVIEEIKPNLLKEGKNIKDFFFSGFYAVHLVENVHKYEEIVNDLSKSINKSKEFIKENLLVGTPDVLLQKLRNLKDLGIKMSIVILKSGSKDLSPNELTSKFEYFTDSVISKL
jgi:alkanesulfonate monooxygenase SsuD/methylene tetrahydromethanopterin reductase-like flavin-dependent oxidoreductase (luciferase family)